MKMAMDASSSETRAYKTAPCMHNKPDALGKCWISRVHAQIEDQHGWDGQSPLKEALQVERIAAVFPGRSLLKVLTQAGVTQFANMS